MNVIFVHGFSVTHTDTYGYLPKWLSQQSPNFHIRNIFLGKYISLVDTILLEDLARAFHQALKDELQDKIKDGFACITHSTGGPLIRLWMTLFYKNKLDECPLKHLIMLAPPNHGSALAQLGKGTICRMKGLLEGEEPGVRILDWLELGSEQSWNLNETWLNYDCLKHHIYVFVLTGQRIDRSLYDHLNSYTGERGSDGVVRVASTNMNYTLLKLKQNDKNTLEIEMNQRSHYTAFGVLPLLSHSGESQGILRSISNDNIHSHPTPYWVLKCLQVSSHADYAKLSNELEKMSTETQIKERKEFETTWFGTQREYETNRYTMLVFRFIDDRNEALIDYDLYLTAGPNGSPNDLPQGFFVDRQCNLMHPNKLTYFVDYDILANGLTQNNMQSRMGLHFAARPCYHPKALVYYAQVDFLSYIGTLIHPNETVMIEIKVNRLVDARAFRIENSLEESAIVREPMKRIIENK